MNSETKTLDYLKKKSDINSSHIYHAPQHLSIVTPLQPIPSCSGEPRVINDWWNWFKAIDKEEETLIRSLLIVAGFHSIKWLFCFTVTDNPRLISPAILHYIPSLILFKFLFFFFFSFYTIWEFTILTSTFIHNLHPSHHKPTHQQGLNSACNSPTEPTRSPSSWTPLVCWSGYSALTSSISGSPSFSSKPVSWPESNEQLDPAAAVRPEPCCRSSNDGLLLHPGLLASDNAGFHLSRPLRIARKSISPHTWCRVKIYDQNQL